MTQKNPKRRRVELSAGEARQGTIILRKPWQLIVFFGGLIAVALIGAVLAFA